MRLGKVIYRERECLNEILVLIIEAETTRAYLELGYKSLINWLVEFCKYSKRRPNVEQLRRC